MNKRNALLLLVLSLLLMAPSDALGQRRGGGGGRMGGGGGGARMGGMAGGARPSFSRSPSMSRLPARPQAPSRPNVQRPNVQLPNTARPNAQRPNVQRPSVQRPNLPTRPSTPSPGGQRPNATRPTQRPSRDQLQGFLNLPAGGASPRPRPGGGTTRPTTRPSIDRDRIKQGIGQTPGRRPQMPDWFEPGVGRPETRPAPRPNRPERPGSGADRPNRPNLPGDGDVDRPGRPNRPTDPKKPNRPGVRPPVAKPPIARPPAARPPAVRPPGARPRPPYARPPRPWYPNHPWHGAYRPGYWWRPATAVGLTGWVAYSWATPNYYSYGPGGSVYYENNTVYVDGQQYASGAEYYDQAATIIESAPVIEEERAAEIEWMPLGVFALTTEGVNASSMYLQLAISKDGLIAGTFYNETTGVTHPVEGMVDEASQRAVWRAADGTNEDIVMETGVYNLTKDQTDALVHFGPDETQVWKMVRLDEDDRPDDFAEVFEEGTTE